MSRELDREVAKIMGLHYPCFPGQREADWQFAHWSDGRPLRMYSELIQEAWQVVEKMREKGYPFALFDGVKDDDGDHWVAQFVACGMAKTAPEAICRAALAAMEGAKEI